jgi:hypothetical protein
VAEILVGRIHPFNLEKTDLDGHDVRPIDEEALAASNATPLERFASRP